MVSELDFVLEKKYANSIHEAWHVDDGYVTLSMCYGIESNDISRKIDEKISKLNQ